jgi:hypothetical protein
MARKRAKWRPASLFPPDVALTIHLPMETGSFIRWAAIESPQINKYLVGVLEGTRPAFDNRESKYYAS